MLGCGHKNNGTFYKKDYDKDQKLELDVKVCQVNDC
jgi:hypothetical protein